MTPDEVLFLTPREVRNLLTMDECIEAVEGAFRMYGERRVVSPEVLSMHTSHGSFHVKAGMLDLGRNYFGAKVNGNFTENGTRFGLPTIQGVIVLCDAERGCPLAIMDSRDITSLRTAAATAVAAKHLARRDSRTVTICGCGTQGRIQIKALSRVCRLQTVFAYDKSPEQALDFTHEVTENLGIPAESVNDLGYAVRSSDICVTCTTSRRAYLSTEEVSPGVFISAVGADSPDKQEIQPTLMANSKIVTDILEQCAVIAGAVIVLARRSVYDLPTALMCIVSLAVLFRWKIPEPILIACAAVGGLIFHKV
jgi:ornithine cyclodeaminase/alanine dehydrogenase